MTTAKVRFRIAAALTQAPDGQRVQISKDNWVEQFRRAFAGLTVELPDHLGEGATRRITLTPRSLSDLTLAGVVKSEPTLSRIAQLAERSPTSSGWLDDLEAVVGRGRLVDECRALLAPPEAEPAAAQETPLLEQLEVTAKPVTSAVDRFVKAIRRPQAAGTPSSPSAARAVRDHVERAVYRTALDALSQPAVSSLESTWRSLRWCLDQLPSSTDVGLEIVDVTPERCLEVVGAIAPSDEFEDPDVLVLTNLPDGNLAAAAALAEQSTAPCVVSLAGPLAALTSDQLTLALAVPESEASDALKAFRAVRADEAGRWLTVAHGDTLVHHEGTGPLERAVLTGGAWVVATMLAASYGATGSFARIVGQPGHVRASATRTLPSADGGMAIPTREFTSIRVQTDLAKLGVLAVGSARNSERVVLATAPTCRDSGDAVPLPAQIWTGRILRFSKWVRFQLPQGSGSDEVREIFEQAGDVFLFPAVSKAAKVTAEIGETDGRRQLMVAARMDASLAMIPLQIEFALPIT